MTIRTSIEKNIIYFSRIAALSFLMLLMHTVIPTGSPESIVLFGSIIGATLGIKISSSKLRFLGVILLVSFTSVIFILIFQGVAIFLNDQVSFYITLQRMEVFILCLAYSLLSTWAYFSIPWFFVVEAAFFIFLTVSTLSFHRNFKLDMPQFINTLSWDIGCAPLTTFILLGSFLLLLLVGYGILSFKTSKILERNNIRRATFDPQRSLAAFFLFLTLLIIAGGSFGVYSYYQKASAGLLSNGVGSESEEGLSPLSFSSALGSTNQPAALLRLENDYPKNPTTPMLYLRESALSVFNGHELVLGPDSIDKEIPKTSPATPFASDENTKLRMRGPLTQIVYLLTDHKLSFAADYPIQITPLKNPNPQKFKGGAFKALSIVPQYTIKELGDFAVGNPQWSDLEKKIYAGAHTDPRYSELSSKITIGKSHPFEKIKAITDFLAQHTIYTLTPNHKEDPKEDPVAPYLFGDGRGYCVHIAHATVYLLRAAGIPSRIATGYLSDLSQARDGHVLLRMSDRHAWAEVFLTGYGWLSFDTQPLRVESHAETEVDQKLLEELMGLINPTEELLPETPNEYKDKPTSTTEIFTSLYHISMFLLCIFLGSLIGTKIFLWHGYHFYPQNTSRTNALLRATIARFIDAGAKRNYGETLSEFLLRLSKEHQETLLSLSDSVFEVKYGNKVDVKTSHIPSLPTTLTYHRRFLALCSPRSSLYYWLGEFI